MELRPDDQVALEAGLNAYFFYDQLRDAVAEVSPDAGNSKHDGLCDEGLCADSL